MFVSLISANDLSILSVIYSDGENNARTVEWASILNHT